MPLEPTQVRWRVLRLSKRGNAPEDYEDAFAADPALGRFAVTDGASEASFAAVWAQLLAEGFVAAPGKPWKELDWLGPARQRWAAAVDGRPLPWYAEAKRAQGAFATLLGLALRQPGPAPDEQPGLWRAVAIGDSCLFQVRGEELQRSFPLSRSEEFGNQPRLCGSRPHGNDSLNPERELAVGKFRPGDRFLLMTDALAQWFLYQTEQGDHPALDVAHLLAQADPQAAFAAWVEERRQRPGLRNDDVTVMIIDV
jgi:hypothetical protein